MRGTAVLSMRRQPARLACLMALSCGIAGCELEPPYHRPLMLAPAAFAQASTSAALRPLPPTEAWWTGFGDPQLQSLLAAAIRNSPDLRIAIDHVMVAQDALTDARSNRFPVIGLTGLPTDPVTTQLRTTNSGRLDVDANIFELALNASYEVDFWGRVRSQVEASQADGQASAADAGAVKIGLLSAVAHRYFELREIDEDIVIAQRHCELAAEQLRLARLRQQAGRTGIAPVEELQLAANGFAAELSTLTRERALAQATLALLVGEAPETVHIDAAPLRASVLAQAPPEGLPASLLERRPDLVAAEARLHAANAQVNLAHTELMPQLALTGKAGFVTGGVTNLLKTGSTIFGVGPDIALPIFNAGRLRAELSASRWREDEAYTEYRKTMLAAFADVERSLLDYQAAVEAGGRNHDDAAIEHAGKTRIDARLQAGRSSLGDALEAQQRELSRDAQAVRAYRLQLDGIVSLYQALGGGWNADDALDAAALAEAQSGPSDLDASSSTPVGKGPDSQP